MLEGAILPTLLRMAAPNSLGFLVQASVSMVEAWYIGQLGTTSLAAIALVFPALMLMQMLSGGAIGGAVTSAIARSLGGGDVERAQKLIWHAVAIAGAASAVFFLLDIAFGKQLLVGLGARGEVLEQAASYADILFGGCLFVWLMSLLGAVFRGMGDMKTPALMMIAGAAVQIPLSGALILGWFGAPQLGIAGGAVSVIAVVRAQLCDPAGAIGLRPCGRTATWCGAAISRRPIRRHFSSRRIGVAFPNLRGADNRPAEQRDGRLRHGRDRRIRHRRATRVLVDSVGVRSRRLDDLVSRGKHRCG